MSTEQRFSTEDVATVLLGVDNDLFEDIGENGVFPSIRTVHVLDIDGNEFFNGMVVELSDAQDGHTETFTFKIYRG